MFILLYGIGIISCLSQVPLQVVSGKIETITYTGTTTTVTCPGQISFTLPRWEGPPTTSSGGLTIYTIDGSEIFNPDKTRVSYADDKRSLLVRNTELSDAGRYICSKQTQGAVGENKVIVRTLPNEPEITTSVTEDNNGVRATEEQTLTVTCTSSGGYPAPTVAWYWGSISGQVLKQTNTGTQVGNTFIVTLNYTFTPTRQDDRQQLVCRSYFPTPTNSQGSQEKSITLYMYLKPDLPVITQLNNVTSGENISVECRTAKGRPAANVSWIYLGQTYTPAVTVIKDTSTQTFTAVSVFQRPVTPVDNGQTVQCRVAHMALSTALAGTTSLDVQFPANPSTTNITGNRDIVANGSNSLTLTCTTGSSNPPSSIIWKNGTDVISNNNTYTNTVGENNGVVRSQDLILRPTRYEHGDNIICSASNRHSQVTDTASVVLNLRYSPLIADISDINVVEGDSSTLKCNASSKPLARFIWKNGSSIIAQGNGTSVYNGLDYTINTVHRNQNGTYLCTADNDIPPTDTQETKLTVLFPPDVTVIAVNSSVLNHSTTVTCEAFGVPDQYNYSGWNHTWNGTIVNHPLALNNTRVLTLTDLSYAHSGVYTCWASNGIKDVSHGSGSLLVKSYPIITGIARETGKLKASGQLMQPIDVKFQFYSNADNTSVRLFRTNGTIKAEVNISYSDVDVQLSVFRSNITTGGTEATIRINVTEERQFGEYELTVGNEIGTVNLSLVIQPSGPPEPPSDVAVTVLDHQSVNVTWISGFANGLNQTFVIQYSTDKITWQNDSLYGGLFFKKRFTKKIDALVSNQLYYLRIVATNDEGESQTTDVLSFNTKAWPGSSPSVGMIVGGAAGGVVAALVIVAIVLFITWRRKKSAPSGNQKDKGALVDTSNENMGFEDREEVINRLYETTGQQQKDTAFTASTSKPTPASPVGADVYAKVNKKPEVVYAMPDKSKDGKKKKGKKDKARTAPGDVYENATNDMYGNGSTAPSRDNIYEEAEVPKNPPRSDGLVYADLEFKYPPKGKDQNKIIGIEDRCEYTTIDVTKKAKPLPDSDD